MDLTLSGFSEDELKQHFKGLEAREKKERIESFDLDAALEAARAAPVAHTGELWQLGDPPVAMWERNRQWRCSALDGGFPGRDGVYRSTLQRGLR